MRYWLVSYTVLKLHTHTDWVATMYAHNIKIHRLAEIQTFNEPDARGFSNYRNTGDGTAAINEETKLYDTIAIGIRLRHPQKPTEFLPLEELLDAMCHELAHCWHTNHGLAFLRQWNTMIDEVEDSLGGGLRVQWGAGDYKKQLESIRVENQSAGANTTKERRQPSKRGIAAALSWKSRA
jgi:hypothetical protein